MHGLGALALLHLLGGLPLDGAGGDDGGEGGAGGRHVDWLAAVLRVLVRRPRHVHVVGEQGGRRRTGLLRRLLRRRRQDQLLADGLGGLEDLQGDVDLRVVELLLVVILLPVGGGGAPQVLLPHVRLDVVAELPPHLAPRPGALVDRLYVLSLQGEARGGS